MDVGLPYGRCFYRAGRQTVPAVLLMLLLFLDFRGASELGRGVVVSSERMRGHDLMHRLSLALCARVRLAELQEKRFFRILLHLFKLIIRSV